MEKQLVKGNQAIAQAAINAGCQSYFGYPITPQSEIGEYMAAKMPELGRTFVPAESELASINMVIGAGATGTKSMTSSSSCGIALMQEAISTMACMQVPGVIVSVMRAGPGLGDITPSQADYFQTLYGGGNGDYKTIVLSPSTVQEAINLTYRAFYLSIKYRNPTILLADGMLGQMMEPAVFPPYPYNDAETSSWAVTGTQSKGVKKLVSLHMGGHVLEKINQEIFTKYKEIQENEVDFESYMTEDASLVITAFGTVARVAKSAVNTARENGLKVGLFRPITLFPFPTEELNSVAKNTDGILDIELNMGQMLHDVKIAVNGDCNVDFFGKVGGQIITESEILTQIEKVYQGVRK